MKFWFLYFDALVTAIVCCLVYQFVSVLQEKYLSSCKPEELQMGETVKFQVFWDMMLVSFVK